MNLFYCPAVPASPGEMLVLPPEESAHAVRVLRMRAGKKIFFTDGNGLFFEGEIQNAHPAHCQVKLLRSLAPSSRPACRLTVAIAPTKSIDRFEWFLEKAAELGCREIIPLLCSHSGRKNLNPGRLQKILISAMKQCLQPQVPLLHPITAFNDFIEMATKQKAQKLIGHIPETDETFFPPARPQGKQLPAALNQAGEKDIIVAVGPEGGFTQEEVNTASSAGFIMISLGNNRLRVETAGVAACSIINALMGE